MKNIYKYFLGSWSIGILFITLISSCKTEQLAPAKEAVNHISGSWAVIAATRNGTDLTTVVDFSKFTVNFAEGKYTLSNPLPFIVNQDGTYALDDPQYPFQISFKSNSGATASTAFTFPIVNGVRHLTLTFSPGCPNNIYVYTFQKVK